MLHLFITVRFLDVLDILLVTFLMYQFYSLVRGTVAINIFVTIFSIYLVWYVTKALNMQLLSSILGQVIGVGIIALVVVFQPEIRRFLLLMGTRYMSRKFGLQNLFLSREVTPDKNKRNCSCLQQYVEKQNRCAHRYRTQLCPATLRRERCNHKRYNNFAPDRKYIFQE